MFFILKFIFFTSMLHDTQATVAITRMMDLLWALAPWRRSTSWRGRRRASSRPSHTLREGDGDIFKTPQNPTRRSHSRGDRDTPRSPVQYTDRTLHHTTSPIPVLPSRRGLVIPAVDDGHMEVYDANPSDTEIDDCDAAVMLGPPSENGDSEPEGPTAQQSWLQPTSHERLHRRY